MNSTYPVEHANRRAASLARENALREETARLARRALSAEEEIALVVAHQKADRTAGGELVARHSGFLRTVVKRWQRLCDVDDLMQEARAELLRAASSFDIARGVRLLSFAGPSIEARVRRYARAFHQPIRGPVAVEEYTSDLDSWRRTSCALSESEIVSAIDIRSEIASSKARRAEVLSLFAQGMYGDEAASAMGISKARVYQLLNDTASHARSDDHGSGCEPAAITIDGVCDSYSGWARRWGIDRTAAMRRIRRMRGECGRCGAPADGGRNCRPCADRAADGVRRRRANKVAA